LDAKLPPQGVVIAREFTLLRLVRSKSLPLEYKRAIRPRLFLCGKLLFDAGLVGEVRKVRTTLEYLDRFGA
jgi:hypothetical protein